jgi:hypothetical protein
LLNLLLRRPDDDDWATKVPQLCQYLSDDLPRDGVSSAISCPTATVRVHSFVVVVPSSAIKVDREVAHE